MVSLLLSFYEVVAIFAAKNLLNSRATMSIAANKFKGYLELLESGGGGRMCAAYHLFC